MAIIDLHNITVTPLKKLLSDKGGVLHGLKSKDKEFVDFGEAYFSIINYKATKAWKMHKFMTLNLIVPYGLIKFVFFDGEMNFREEIIGYEKYARLTIPPLVWFGFYGLFEPHSILLNIADIAHDQDEIELKKISDIKYSWDQNI